MARTQLWSKHYHSVWMDRAGDRRLPPWLRVAALAYGSHRANGHANFKAGQVGLVLGSVDPYTSHVKPMDKSNVQKAIRKAVEYGWLVEGSGTLCLIVPGHAVSHAYGDPRSPCPVHQRRVQGRSNRTHLQGKDGSNRTHQVGTK